MERIVVERRGGSGTNTIDIAAHRWRRRLGRAILYDTSDISDVLKDVILWPATIDARLATEAGPRRICGLAI